MKKLQNPSDGIRFYHFFVHLCWTPLNLSGFVWVCVVMENSDLVSARTRCKHTTRWLNSFPSWVPISETCISIPFLGDCFCTKALFNLIIITNAHDLHPPSYWLWRLMSLRKSMLFARCSWRWLPTTARWVASTQLPNFMLMVCSWIYSRTSYIDY